MKNFVVVVDTQYDFMLPDGILYVKGAEETIIPITQYLASLTPEETEGVMFTFDTHIREEYEGSPESQMFPLHCELGTKGHRNVINENIVNEFINVVTLEKPVFDMWNDKAYIDQGYVQDDVSDFFHNLKNNSEIEIVDVIGVALNFCVKQAVDGFLERGFRVRLHTSLTRGIDTGKPGDLDARILYAEEILNGNVVVID